MKLCRDAGHSFRHQIARDLLSVVLSSRASVIAYSYYGQRSCIPLLHRLGRALTLRVGNHNIYPSGGSESVPYVEMKARITTYKTALNAYVSDVATIPNLT